MPGHELSAAALGTAPRVAPAAATTGVGATAAGVGTAAATASAVERANGALRSRRDRGDVRRVCGVRRRKVAQHAVERRAADRTATTDDS